MPKHSPYSDAEKQMYADAAALLDPEAYTFVNGASASVGPVPAGKQWYCPNFWGVVSSIDFTVTGSVVSGDRAFTAAALIGDEGGLSIVGAGVVAGRALLRASAGAGVLNSAATATSTDTSYRLFSVMDHRELRAVIDEAYRMPAGMTLVVGPAGGYIYVCKPELVIPAPYGTGTDDRYVDDPKALFYDRLHALRSLTMHRLDKNVPPGAPINTVTVKDFPADFDGGMLMHAHCRDGAWVALNSPTLGAMNLMGEINDFHAVRLALATLCPFKRTTFPQFRVAGANMLGNTQMPYGSGYGGAVTPFSGYGGCSYMKLPGGW